MIISLMKTATLCMLLFAINVSNAQKLNNTDKERVIEVNLDSIPGILSNNLNFNDFFAESYITAKVTADRNGNAEKIRIGRCRTTLSGNSNSNSLKTARKLLLESSRTIIKNTVWNEGKNRCRIIWKPRHSQSKRKTDKINNGLKALADGCITEDEKKRIRGTDGSVFLLARTDTTGIICDIDHIGNIYWKSDNAKNENADIKGLSITFFSNSSSSAQMRNAYQSYEEKEQHATDKIYNNCAKAAEKRLLGKSLSEFTAKQGDKRACIEINIDATGIEIEENGPVFCGGTGKLRRILEENLKSSKILRKSNATGAIMVKFIVKKNGKCKILGIQSRIPENCSTGSESKEKLSKEIYDNISKTMKRLPDWTPGTRDGKATDTVCKLKIKI